MSEQRIRSRVWRNGAIEASDVPLDRLDDYLEQPDCLVWLDLCRPDEQTMHRLAEKLQLDDHAVEDALTEEERPKAARYPGHLFLTTSAIECAPDVGALTASRISAFGLERAFVTVRLDDRFDIDAVVRRWDDNAELLRYGERALVHGLLDEIVDGYFTVVETLDDGIERIEDLLFDETSRDPNELQRKTFALRKSLVHARRVVLPMREVVNTVMRKATAEGATEQLVPYFTDLYDHTLRAAEWVDSLRDMVGSVIDTNMSLADSRMNAIMKKLTGWAAIVAVPTAITGYFGQNVPFPGNGNLWGFWLSIGLMVVLAVLLYAVFRRKDWL